MVTPPERVYGNTMRHGDVDTVMKLKTRVEGVVDKRANKPKVDDVLAKLDFGPTATADVILHFSLVPFLLVSLSSAYR
jgi:hypothetical protein